MNLNIYIKDTLYQELHKYSQLLNRTRNNIITEALSEWVSRQKQKGTWSEDIFKFDKKESGIYPDADALREDLSEPGEFLL